VSARFRLMTRHQQITSKTVPNSDQRAAGERRQRNELPRPRQRPCLEAGLHIKAVADLLGHSSVAVTGGSPSTFNPFCRSIAQSSCDSGGVNLFYAWRFASITSRTRSQASFARRCAHAVADENPAHLNAGARSALKDSTNAHTASMAVITRAHQ